MHRTSLLKSLLVFLVTTTVEARASWWDTNETISRTPSTDGLEAPFPGTKWLDRIANPSTAFVAKDGTSYSSVYDAFMYGAPQQHPCRNFNTYVNSFVISPTVATWVVNQIGGSLEWGHYILCYMRNFVAAVLVYYSIAAIFHYHCYIHPRSKITFENRPRPTWDTMWDQIKLAQASMILYTALPVVDEYLIENDWTLVYYTVEEIGGWVPCLLLTVLYFALVEIGIYWMHRTLHTNKFLYKHVHMIHHKYNRPDTLTPWCSIAFHPLDGILQCSPYVLVLPIVPIHYGLHVGLLFFTVFWATYIHDAMDFNIDPIMGSKYHTVHHTHYIYNYGQVFTFCDRIWGTFKVPDGPTGVPSKRTALERTSRMKKSD